MAINMNSLPSEKPAFGTVIPKGTYIAKIVKTSMKQGADDSKPPYFVAECEIRDQISKMNMGRFWINLYESEANLCRYQLGRFIKACELNIQGEFELKDLTKMVPEGKLILVDIKPEERKDGKAPQKSVVDIDAMCFYEYTPTEDSAPDAPFLAAAGITETPSPQIQANY